MEYWPVLYHIENYFLLTLSHRIDNFLCVVKLIKGGLIYASKYINKKYPA